MLSVMRSSRELVSVAEPLDVIGTAERVSFDDFVAASSARLFAVALRQCEHRPAAAEELLRYALARACRHWARISRSADPEARVRQMLVDSSSRGRRPQASGGRAEVADAAGAPPAGLMAAVRHQHRRYQRRLRAGCVLAAVVVALAVSVVALGSLVAHGPRARLGKAAASGHPSPGKIVSCVDAWHTHEARIICARFAGPPVAPRVVMPSQVVSGPAACAAERALKAGC